SPAAAQARAQTFRCSRRGRGGTHVHFAHMIAHVRGRLASKSADRVVVETAGGVGYEVVVPLGVMERLPSTGAEVTLVTELVVREDGWAVYGFLGGMERRCFAGLAR